MRNDPIVEEVRRAGDRIARQCGYDLHKFCERMRQVQREFEDRARTAKAPIRRHENAMSGKRCGKRNMG